MATIENKSRTQVSVKKRDDLTKFFPYNKIAEAAAYVARLEEMGLKPTSSVLDEAYLVRWKNEFGKRVSKKADSAQEAEATKKKIEADQYQGLLVDYNTAHQLKLSDLLIRYLWEEAPRLKGFLITAYQINSWLVDAGLPRQDIAAVHAAHKNPQDRNLHIPTPNGHRMSEPNEAARFILKPFSKIGPTDFSSYVDERVEDVDTATADRELDIIRRVCSVAINKWRIHVQIDPFAGYERPDYFNERDRRLRRGEEERLMDAAADEDYQQAVLRQTHLLLIGSVSNSKYARMASLAKARPEAELTCNHVPVMAGFIQFQLKTGARRSETLRLKWEHVDLEAQTAYLPDTKNGRARTLPLMSSLVEWLKHLPRTSEYVFPITVPYLRKAWKRICKAAGIATEGNDRLRIHDLRHEAISRVAEIGSLAAGGISLVDLQAFSGHRDTRMLLRYTHLTPGGMAKRLDEAFKDQKQVTFHHGRRRLKKNASVSMAEVVATPLVVTARKAAPKRGKVAAMQPDSGSAPATAQCLIASPTGFPGWGL